jgi:hypothetical protein
MIHYYLPTVAAALVNKGLAADIYSLKQPIETEADRQREELLTLVIPVFVGFCAAYLAEGDPSVLTPSQAMLSGFWQAVFTAVGGAFTGVGIDAYKASHPERYARTPDALKNTPYRQIWLQTLDFANTYRNAAHRFFARMPAGVSGYTAAGSFQDNVGPVLRDKAGELGGAALSAGVGMFIFLGCWFAFLQAGGAVGDALDRRVAARNAGESRSSMQMDSVVEMPKMDEPLSRRARLLTQSLALHGIPLDHQSADELALRIIVGQNRGAIETEILDRVGQNPTNERYTAVQNAIGTFLRTVEEIGAPIERDSDVSSQGSE